MTAFRCKSCEAAFDHPITTLDDECQTVGGKCAHLMSAGWRSVWVKVYLEAPIGDQDRHLFSQGWICPACVEKYAAPIKGRLAPAKKRQKPELPDGT